MMLNEDKRLKLLVAWPYMSKTAIKALQQNVGRFDLLLDSGAFTAWKSGNPLSLDGYCKFIDSLVAAGITPWRYVNLDVIGNHKLTVANWEEMRRRGYDPVPVFTRGMPISVLEDYYRVTDFVAIGGMVGLAGSDGFVKGIMQAVNGRRVHLLGFTKHRFVGHFRPFSCDSSGWEAPARFGRLAAVTASGSPVSLKFGEPVEARMKSILHLHGVTTTDVIDRKWWHGGYSGVRQLAASIGVYESFMVTRHFQTKLFLAAAVDSGINLLFNRHQWLLNRGLI